MENNLTYIQNGDYLIPELKLTEQPPKPLGKYGRMRKTYLKEHRPILFQKLVLEEKIAHGGHPVLRWMMDNIYIRTDPAGNIKADKEKSTEKIDGAIATIMGLDRAIRCGNDTGASVYDSRGLLFI